MQPRALVPRLQLRVLKIATAVAGERIRSVLDRAAVIDLLHDSGWNPEEVIDARDVDAYAHPGVTAFTLSVARTREQQVGEGSASVGPSLCTLTGKCRED